MSRSALVLCLLAAVCGAAHPSRLTPEPHGCIIGGEPVDISQFPWQVSLERNKDGRLKHFCGGSIISSTWVLTAAHCIRPRLSMELYVRAGSSYRNTGGTVHKVDTKIYHENFSFATADYDFALLEISEPVSFGSNVQAVNLGTSEMVSGTKVNVSGWGLNSSGVKPEQLHAVTTTIVDRDTCRKAYADFPRNITERMICAGEEEGGKGAYRGDGGGPLVAGNTQYGVVSWCWECAETNRPAVYSNVPALRGWITEKTGV